MRVMVGPAKRLGNEKIILSLPLDRLQVELDDDEVQLCFCAEGIYDNKSQYRYTMQFSRSEMQSLLGGRD